MTRQTRIKLPFKTREDLFYDGNGSILARIDGEEAGELQFKIRTSRYTRNQAVNIRRLDADLDQGTAGKLVLCLEKLAFDKQHKIVIAEDTTGDSPILQKMGYFRIQTIDKPFTYLNLARYIDFEQLLEERMKNPKTMEYLEKHVFR